MGNILSLRFRIISADRTFILLACLRRLRSARPPMMPARYVALPLVVTAHFAGRLLTASIYRRAMFNYPRHFAAATLFTTPADIFTLPIFMPAGLMPRLSLAAWVDVVGGAARYLHEDISAGWLLAAAISLPLTGIDAFSPRRAPPVAHQWLARLCDFNRKAASTADARWASAIIFDAAGGVCRLALPMPDFRRRRYCHIMIDVVISAFPMLRAGALSLPRIRSAADFGRRDYFH